MLGGHRFFLLFFFFMVFFFSSFFQTFCDVKAGLFPAFLAAVVQCAATPCGLLPLVSD